MNVLHRRRRAPRRSVDAAPLDIGILDRVSDVNSPLTVLTVHAHPDDEASKGAPTLAKYKAEGARTVLVCATGGEEGDLHNPTLRDEGQPFHGMTPEEEKVKVASLREAELAASAAVIGFDEVVMLGYRDSGMAETEPNEHPNCFHQADLDEAVGRLVAVIRRVRSQVIITYGDDQKGYPHPDHLKVHDISVLAFDRAGDPEWYPELGEPFEPAKLYYAVWAKARILAVHEAMLKYTGESPFSEEWLEREGQDHRITTKIEVGDFQWARTGALRAHATQIDPSAGWWFGLDDQQLAETYPWEDWILARNRVGPIPEDDSERDLFAGLRAEVDA
ncbi:PIG-L family deacetylase [Ilumatobacter nonamiensis]|uniref:PIG-L family deacetylase n=1 Tax=Ilumatobacter nonamiensis TaxID=467093 RepID=UPI000688B483|nr:PIG-L family deacetylase [Ilumatobacter nonamiensis]